MRIMITGATGFIGRATLIHLVKQGHEITAVVRKIDASSDLPCKSVLWDSMKDDSSILAPHLENIDAIVHLAGEPVASSKWTPEKKESIRASRVVGTRRIVEAIETLPPDSRPKQFICASAIGFYGERGDELLTENSAPGSGFLSEVVKEWEAEAGKAERWGLRVVQLRIGVVLGRNGGALEKMKPVTLGTGKQWMSWVHLKDIVRFVQFALEHAEASGAYNLTSPNPVRNSDFTRAFASARGQHNRFRAPEVFLKGILGEMSGIILGSIRAIPKRAEQLGFDFEFQKLEDALPEIYNGQTSTEERFSSIQFVPQSIEKVFGFFCKAENLEALTPPWLNFHIIGKSTKEIQENTLIDYRLKIHGVPVRWQSKIESWKPNVLFVDTQTRGPYSKWHHTHRFESVAGGTLVYDDVIYRVPGGEIGALLGGFPIRKDIVKIFAYRKSKIAEIFKQ